MNWNDLWAAFALYLVLEGVLHFLNPGAAKRQGVSLNEDFVKSATKIVE